MASRREMVSKVRSSLKLVNFDNIISDRFIDDEMRTASLKLIKQQIDKRKLLTSPNIFSTIPCLKMASVPITECCDYTSKCKIGKSLQPLPKLGESSNYGVLVQGVFSIDRAVKFKQTDPNRYVNYLNLYPKAKDKETFFWVGSNNHLYITSPDIEIVRIIAFFEEDIDWTIYTCDERIPDCNPNPLDTEFRCPGYLENDVLNIVRDTLMKTYERTTDDKTQNSNDEKGK